MFAKKRGTIYIEAIIRRPHKPQKQVYILYDIAKLLMQPLDVDG